MDGRQNTENNEEMNFDKTVSAFSGMPPFQRNEDNTAAVPEMFDEIGDEEDDFDRTVSAFLEPKSVKKDVTATEKKATSYWSTTQGKVVKIVFILLPILCLSIFLGPVAILIWIFAFWFVFRILK